MLVKAILMEDELCEPNDVIAGSLMPFWKHYTLTAPKKQNMT